MRYGLIPAAGRGISATPSYIADYVQTAEEVGFDSVWMGEHPALPVNSATAYPAAGTGLPEPSDVPLPDPLEWLAYAAARTTTLLVGTAVLILPLHHPAVMAKRVATLDQVSGGRLRLGVGVGWNEQEYVACGASWSDRGQRMDELIDAMRALWSNDVAGFTGRTVSFEPVYSSPKPMRGTVPIHVGATAVAGARRAGRLGDGYLPFERDLDRLAVLIGEMRAAAVADGRDPDAIEITSMGSTTPAKVQAMARLGVSRMLFFADDVAALPELAAQGGRRRRHAPVTAMPTMRAVRRGESGIETVDVPIPDADGLRVHVRAAGICGSDVHALRYGPSPVTLGHEFGGVLDDGTPVAVVPNVSCGECAACGRGEENLCRDATRKMYGITLDGGMAEQVIVRPSNVLPLPPGLPPEVLALVEPISIAIHGLHRAQVQPGMKVLVVGAGSIGLATVMAARWLGVDVDVAARHPHQQAAADALGGRADRAEGLRRRGRLGRFAAGARRRPAVRPVRRHRGRGRWMVGPGAARRAADAEGAHDRQRDLRRPPSRSVRIRAGGRRARTVVRRGRPPGDPPLPPRPRCRRVRRRR